MTEFKNLGFLKVTWFLWKLVFVVSVKSS